MITGDHHPAREHYQVSTPLYEGPLDLLLQLIERAELDITKLSLALVTDQYLAHIRELTTGEEEQSLSPDDVSSFLVIAARLVQIKSEALLPRPVEREAGEEDPGEALAEQLRAYKRYKEIAGHLDKRRTDGLRTYLRVAPPPKIEGRLDLSDINIDQLVEAALAVYLQEEKKSPLTSVVTAPKVTIREKIGIISSVLRSSGKTSFFKLLGETKTRIEIVVTFLAVLELVKQHFIAVQQDTTFGEINIEPAENWTDTAEIELEFGE